MFVIPLKKCLTEFLDKNYFQLTRMSSANVDIKAVTDPVPHVILCRVLVMTSLH